MSSIRRKDISALVNYSFSNNYGLIVLHCIVYSCCLMTLCYNKDHSRRPPFLSRLESGTVRMRTVEESDVVLYLGSLVKLLLQCKLFRDVGDPMPKI